MTPQMQNLIERVRAIDSDAADYLAGDEIKELPMYNCMPTGLDSVVAWWRTPQGHEYWAGICYQLKDGYGW